MTTPASGAFTVSDYDAPAGTVTFHFVSHSPASQQGGGSDVELFGLRNGVSLAQVADHIRAQQGPQTKAGAAAAAASTRWLVANTRVYGGASIQGVGSADVTTFLPAGTIYALDLNSVFGGGHVYSKTLRVYGPTHRGLLPRIAGTVSVTSTDRFAVTSTSLPRGNYLVRNPSDTIHFVAFQPVKPGTTNADITKVANAEMAGKNPGVSPYLNKEGVGAGVISPGQQEIISSAVLTPGTYDLECFVADDVTGMPHFFMGMHKIVVIR